jgi:hypothetical protein
MVDPRQHASEKGWLETILHYIPGFRGYLQAEDRRESDRLARVHLTNRLLVVKQHIEAWQEYLVNAGNLDDLTHCERIVTAIFTLGNRLSGDVQGYSGFFDFVQIDNEKLDRIYEHDLALVHDVDELVKATSARPGSTEPVASVAAALSARLATLQQKYQERENILTGLEATPS